MIASLLASVLAVSAIQDTVTLIPGAAVRFGTPSSQFGAAQGFQASPAGADERRSERTGTMRFFGIDAAATLRFFDRRLVEAEFVIESASPRQITYIEDDLRRRGYRRQCTVREPARDRCTWMGDAHVEMAREGARISAIVRPRTRKAPPAPAAGTPAPPSAGATHVHPDTLDLAGGAMTEHVERAVHAPYPEAARAAGVMGVVRMLALVDTSGAVTEIRIRHSIPELDESAVDALRQWRFRPFQLDGRPVARWVIVPMRFTLH